MEKYLESFKFSEEITASESANNVNSLEHKEFSACHSECNLKEASPLEDHQFVTSQTSTYKPNNGKSSRINPVQSVFELGKIEHEQELEEKSEQELEQEYAYNIACLQFQQLRIKFSQSVARMRRSVLNCLKISNNMSEIFNNMSEVSNYSSKIDIGALYDFLKELLESENACYGSLSDLIEVEEAYPYLMVESKETSEVFYNAIEEIKVLCHYLLKQIKEGKDVYHVLLKKSKN